MKAPEVKVVIEDGIYCIASYDKNGQPIVSQGSSLPEGLRNLAEAIELSEEEDD